MLPIILATATIVGGIAAVVFFWDRIRPNRAVDSLSAIQREVSAVRAPLVPCGLFLTLHYSALPADVEALFKDEIGFRAFGSDKPMPPPPLGLPPGMSKGRVVWRYAYLQFDDARLSAAGLVDLTHPAYNGIHLPASHTVASLSSDAIEAATNHPLLAVPTVVVKFVLDKAKRPRNAPVPELGLRSVVDKHRVMRVRALDNDIFVDQFIPLTPASGDSVNAWSVPDLNGARLEVSLGFFYIEPLFWLPQSNWPAIHNLQLWFGPDGAMGVTFSLEELASQQVSDDPNVPVSGQARAIRVRFQSSIGDLTSERLVTRA